MKETPTSAEAAKPCPYCDDSGDVHSADGEWRGICSCKAGDEIRARIDSERATQATTPTNHEGPQ